MRNKFSFIGACLLLVGLLQTSVGSAQSYPYNPNQSERPNSRYLELDRIGTGCDDQLCLWLLGQNIASPDTRIEVSSTYGGQYLATYGGNQLVKTNSVWVDGRYYSRITVRLDGSALNSFVRTGSVRVRVVSGYGEQSNSMIVYTAWNGRGW